MNEIINIDVLDGFKNIPDQSQDIILIDPPYFQVANEEWDKWKSFDEYLAWAKKWINEAVRTIKPSGTFYIYGFDERLSYLSVMLPLDKVRHLVWYYKNKAVPRSKWFGRSHESIICYSDKNNRVFNVDDVRTEYSKAFLTGAAGKKRTGTIGRFGSSGDTIYTAHEKGALARDTIECPSLAGGSGVERHFLCHTCSAVYFNKDLDNHKDHKITQHSTQKPKYITEVLLKACRNKDKETHLLVPFVGSGSEVKVAESLGIEYTIGFELNKEYWELATKFVGTN